MGINWGGFGSGFADGLGNGMRLGSAYKKAKQEHDANKVRDAAVKESKALHEQAVAVADNGLQGQKQEAAQGPAKAPVNTYQVDLGLPQQQAQAVPQAPSIDASLAGAPGVDAQPAQPAPAAQMAAQGLQPQKRFTAAGQGFDDEGAARAAARDAAPSLKDFTASRVAEKLEQHFIEAGDIEQAEKWGQWHRNKQNKQKMDTWADGYKLAQTGDYMGAARKFIKLYPDYKDGIDLVSAEPYKDESGREAGFDIVVKGPDGERSMRMDAQSISKMGAAQLNPQAMFEMDRQELLAAAREKAKIAADRANDARTSAAKLAEIGLREAGSDRRMVAKETAANKREEYKAKARETQAERDIRLKAELRAKGKGGDPRTVGLAPHPLKVDKDVRAEFKEDSATYRVKDANGKIVEAKFQKLPKALQDVLVKKIVDDRLAAYNKPVAPKAAASYQGAAVYDPDEDDEDED